MPASASFSSCSTTYKLATENTHMLGSPLQCQHPGRQLVVCVRLCHKFNCATDNGTCVPRSLLQCRPLGWLVAPCVILLYTRRHATESACMP